MVADCKHKDIIFIPILKVDLFEEDSVSQPFGPVSKIECTVDVAFLKCSSFLYIHTHTHIYIYIIKVNFVENKKWKCAIFPSPMCLCYYRLKSVPYLHINIFYEQTWGWFICHKFLVPQKIYYYLYIQYSRTVSMNCTVPFLNLKISIVFHPKHFLKFFFIIKLVIIDIDLLDKVDCYRFCYLAPN